MTGEKKALHKGRRHTRESVQSPLVRTKSKYLLTKVRKGGDFFMANQVMRITLKAYEHQLVDASAKKSSKLLRRPELR